MRYGIIPPEPPAIASPDGLAPRFRAKVLNLQDRMKARNHSAIILESLRTDKRQQWLYQMGRSYDDGRGIVTNAANAHFSWHFYGLAVDMGPEKDDLRGNVDFYHVLIDEVWKLELTSGAYFATIADRPHVQSGPPMRKSPSWHAYALYTTGGYQAVWKAVAA